MVVRAVNNSGSGGMKDTHRRRGRRVAGGASGGVPATGSPGRGGAGTVVPGLAIATWATFSTLERASEAAGAKVLRQKLGGTCEQRPRCRCVCALDSLSRSSLNAGYGMTGSYGLSSADLCFLHVCADEAQHDASGPLDAANESRVDQPCPCCCWRRAAAQLLW